MKQFFFLMTLLLAFPALHAQDQIITIHSDTLHCRITESKSGEIKYSFQNADSSQVYNASIPMSQVREIRSATYTTNGKMKYHHTNFSRIWVHFGGGYSRRLGKIPEELSNSFDSYMNQLRNGYCIGGSITYFPGNNVGLGLKYDLHRSRASWDLAYSEPIKENISIHFIAPAITLRFVSPKSNNAGYLTAAFGIIRYHNAASIPDQIEINAKTTGLSLDFGYAISISDAGSVTLGCGIATGYYESFELTGSGKKFASNESFKTNGDNLLRLNLTVGLIIR